MVSLSNHSIPPVSRGERVGVRVAVPFILSFLWFFLIPACQRSVQQTTQPASLPDHGRELYLTYCIACHNSDPSLDGPLGPPIKGSNKILLEAKVLHNTYPEGHTPKRPSKAMVPMPFLANDLDALEAFLKK